MDMKLFLLLFLHGYLTHKALSPYRMGSIPGMGNIIKNSEICTSEIATPRKHSLPTHPNCGEERRAWFYKTPKNCYGCTVGQFYFKDQCIQCPEKCISCVSETQCTMCKIGYYGESCSLTCSQYCHDYECDKITGVCLSCMKGYYAAENKSCISCPAPCLTCKSNSYCFACKNGFYGEACEKSCSNCKNETSCDKTTGYCLKSCKEGFTGDLCDVKCDVKCHSCARRNKKECTTCALGRYDILCNKNCSSNCFNNVCNRSNGICTYGCQARYWGQMCEKSCSANCKYYACVVQNGTCLEGCLEGYYEHNCSKAHVSVPANFHWIDGLVIGLCLIILVAVCLCCYKYRKSFSTEFKKLHPVDEYYHLYFSYISEDEPEDNVMEDDVMSSEKLSESNTKTISGANAVQGTDEPETASVFKKTIVKDGSMSDADCKGSLSKTTQQETKSHGEAKIINENITSQAIRFVDIDSYKTSNKYIVSYGPNNPLMDSSFWKKIWEIRCELVVMLSIPQATEEFNGEYIIGSQQNGIIIKYVTGNSMVNYTMILVTLKKIVEEKIVEKRDVTLFDFFAWPKVGVPDNVLSFSEFHNMAKGVETKLGGPTLVHSDEKQRCGRYIAYDMLKNNTCNLNRDDCLEHLKKSGLETTHEQMEHLYQMLVT